MFDKHKNKSKTNQEEQRQENNINTESDSINNCNCDSCNDCCGNTQAEHCCKNSCECDKQKDEITNLKEELAKWQDRYLRAYADAENTKRKSAIDAKNLVDYKLSEFALSMIPMADNLTLAISSIKDKVDENIIVGLQAVLDGFVSALKNNGIEKINTKDCKFDPSCHMVVSKIESDKEEGTIIEEMQAGYKLGDKVIREAMVTVATSKK